MYSAYIWLIEDKLVKRFISLNFFVNMIKSLNDMKITQILNFPVDSVIPTNELFIEYIRIL